jgi:hypothetical protein
MGLSSRTMGVGFGTSNSSQTRERTAAPCEHTHSSHTRFDVGKSSGVGKEQNFGQGEKAGSLTVGQKPRSCGGRLTVFTAGKHDSQTRRA